MASSSQTVPGWYHPTDQSRHHRDGFWDYCGRAIYHITLAINERRPLFGELAGDSPEEAFVRLSALGWYAYEALMRIPAHQAEKGGQLRLLAIQLMPDHLHVVLHVMEPMPNSIGEVVRAFKSTVTSEYIRQTGGKVLWEPLNAGYHEKILHQEGQLARMINYVKDNPRRAMIRRLNPDMMQRCLHVKIGERDYGAFGNVFLLRRARLLPVFCHRWRMVEGERDYRIAYETTPEYATQREQWLAAAREGAVLVTAGISKGEQIIKHVCEEEGLPLIHLQKERIGRFWKPEERRFYACARGDLLILAPWEPEELGDVNGAPSESDYAIFHNLNTLAEEICAFEGEAYIIRGGR